MWLGLAQHRYPSCLSRRPARTNSRTNHTHCAAQPHQANSGAGGDGAPGASLQAERDRLAAALERLAEVQRDLAEAQRQLMAGQKQLAEQQTRLLGGGAGGH